MDRIVISIGDFLKNAGIVGMEYMLKTAGARNDIDYGFMEDEHGIWLDREFAQNADWTDMYFQAFIKRYGPLTAYRGVLEKINKILEKSENDDWNKSECKEDLKFINEKLLSNSYKSGFANIKNKIDNPDVYERLKDSKLKDSMEKEELCERLVQLKGFLEQPLCEETFSMKSIIYNYINRFWDGKSFLLRANAAKDMKEVFEADFSAPLKAYVSAEHKKAKDMCIDCNNLIDSKERVSIAFMKDQADDLNRKRSAFWNCRPDAWLCPVCAFVYALAPLGFTLIGRTFLFVNLNQNIEGLIRINSSHGMVVSQSGRKKEERYSSWIARTIDLLLHEKGSQISNVQVITRDINEDRRYTFDIIARDVLILLNDDSIIKALDNLGRSPYLKDGKDYWNVHETVMLNILRYNSQYAVINKMLKMAIDNSSILPKAGITYDIQLRTNLLRRNKLLETGGKLMNNSRYALRDEGYKLRNVLLGAKGTSDDACIRGTVYQLLNALSVGNVEHFMEIIMRIYCSTKLQVPNAFIEFLKDKDTFMEYGYAFLLGLQGSHYEKKEEVTNG